MIQISVDDLRALLTQPEGTGNAEEWNRLRSQAEAYPIVAEANRQLHEEMKALEALNAEHVRQIDDACNALGGLQEGETLPEALAKVRRQWERSQDRVKELEAQLGGCRIALASAQNGQMALEADARLGRLVRAMPQSWRVMHCVHERDNYWDARFGSRNCGASGNSPEEALLAAGVRDPREEDA